MPLPQITEETIRNLASNSSYWKGVDYYENGNLKRLWIEKDKYALIDELKGISPKNSKTAQVTLSRGRLGK